MKRIFTLAITLMVIGLVVVPQVQAQTRQQQQELEQIAKRSVNGLSSQDRQRVIQIMTDVYVTQGMSQQQAAQFAAMAADSMFTSDVGNMPPPQQASKPNLMKEAPVGATIGWPSDRLFNQQVTIKFRAPNIRTTHGITTSYETYYEVGLIIYISKNYMDADARTAFWTEEEKQWFINYIQQATGASLTRINNSSYQGETKMTRDELVTVVEFEEDRHYFKITLRKEGRGTGGGRGR